MLGRPPGERPAQGSPKGRINTTDLDSTPVRTRRGFIQGYNAQAASTERQIVVAADLIARSPDGGQLEPMVAAAHAELGRAGVAEVPQVVLADAGYWSRSQIERLKRRGIDPLVPPDGSARRGPPSKGRRDGPYAEMRAALRSERGGDLYRRRQRMIEPVFAQVKVLRHADRFQRRGLAACRAEWRLITATHNLLKLWRAGGLAAA